ncbi:hypothetical protein ONZ45_g16151 [Pleurotus djamor]|nr:hypothetical protein ONZ45_g16151 [Pleurotus djamor]
MRNLLLLSLSFISPYALAEQAPFVSHSRTSRFYNGTLRRFDGVDVDWLLDIAHENELDIWRVDSASSSVDIYLPDEARTTFPQSLRSIPHVSSTISTLVPSTIQDKWNLSSLQNTSYHSAYHPTWEIDEFLRALVEMHPEEATLLRLGHSAEGREMYGVKIATGRKEKMGFVLTGAQHAREWVAISTAQYIAHALLSDADEPQSLRYLLDDFDFYMIPLPNPDGYSYTWETDRFWYKNRQSTGPGSSCVGIDMNRNWGYKWKPYSTPSPFGEEEEQSTKKPKRPKKKPLPDTPCSVWFPGHRPFESPEVNNVANFIGSLNGAGGPQGRVKAFVDLRSYGQMLSSPYSYTCSRIPKDAEDQLEAALGSVQALRVAHGTVFKTGSLCDTLYRAPGNIVDWMYARAGIKYSYAAFLRDTGTYGFSIPPEWIRPIGEETGRMVSYLGEFIVKQNK